MFYFTSIQRKLTISLLCIVFLTSQTLLAANNETIYQLDSLFAPYKHLIKSDPFSVIKALESTQSSKLTNDTLSSQKHLLLSISYASLEFPDSAADNAKLALNLIEKQQQPWLFHQIKLAQAYAFDRQGSPQKGLSEVDAAIMWAENQRDNALLVRALDIRAGLLTSLVQYIKANQDLERALSLAPETVDPLAFKLEKTKGDLQLTFAMIYEYRDESANSIEYLEKAVEYHRQNENWYWLASSLYGLGFAQRSIGNIELGRSLLTESSNLAKQINDFQGAAYALKELAVIEEKLGNDLAAEQMSLDAIETFKLANNVYMYIAVSRNLVRLALKNDQLDKAQQHLDFAFQYVNKDTMPYQELGLQLEQSRLLAARGKYKEAFELANIITKKRYKLLQDQSSQELNRMRSHYEFNEKEQLNRLLEKENSINKIELENAQRQNNFLFTIIILSVLIVILLLHSSARLRKHKKELEKLANTDGLTGLLNRRKSLELMSQQLDLAKRHHHDFCLVLIDLDWFKNINDTFGHGIGDQVLVKFSRLCLDTLRHTDIVARYGGEEFLIALPFTSLKDADNLIRKLKKNTNELPKAIGIEEINGTSLEITFSAGISHQYQNTSIEEMINQTDLALYQAKHEGRNRIVIYQEH